MYIERVIRLSLLFACAAFLLSGCIFGSDDGDSTVPRPALLDPESNAFSGASARTYLRKEYKRLESGDSLLAQTTLGITSSGDTLIAGISRVRIAVTGASVSDPAPAATFALLGFRAARLAYDSAAIPDAGDGLRFPEIPATGWRLDTTVAGLRRVRAYARTQTISTSGARYACWLFNDSVWVGSRLLGAGTLCMGAPGLVRHRFEWFGIVPGGSFYREFVLQ